jgi:hypothetical protein
MGLATYIDEVGQRTRSISVYDTGDREGIERLSAFFGSVEVRGVTDHPGLISRFSAPVPDRDAVAISTIDELGGDYVLVDSEFEVVGTLPREELDVPEFVVRFDETTFRVAEGNKPLLNEMSRHIERLALRRDAGQLLTGVQELSRLRIESRTDETYRRLADSNVDTHVFGRGDSDDTDRESSVHESDAAEIADSWFVVFRDDDAGAALVAVETDPNTYRGFWTFERDLVEEIADYIERTYLERSASD